MKIARMNKPSPDSYIENRWPVSFASIAVLALLIVLPARIRMFPTWIPYLLVMALNVPILVLTFGTTKARWLRIEGIVTFMFLVIVGVSNVITLKRLFTVMLSSSANVTGVQLLASSVGVWATNILVFSLAYWRIDRGGPEAREDHASSPDWLFPQENEGASYHRHTTFPDYLFLAFWTAMAFSPTDAAPLSYRAKLLMLFESIISLLTLLVVAARAVNILGA